MVSWKHKTLCFQFFSLALKICIPVLDQKEGKFLASSFEKRILSLILSWATEKKKYLSTQQELDPRASNFAAQFSTTEPWKTLFIRVNTFCTAYMKISGDRNWLTACLKLAKLTSCRFISVCERVVLIPLLETVSLQD